jgi:hypothetical protein
MVLHRRSAGGEMSWGERSCKHKPCIIPNECKIETCNVDCREYEWDGKTEPDSVKTIMDFREKFIDTALRFLLMNSNLLSEWERGFIKSIEDYSRRKWKLSIHQYNMLQEIYRRLR